MFRTSLNQSIIIFAPGYAGDYIGMTAYNDKVYAAWMDNRSGTWQIYVSRVSDVDISGDNSFCTTSNPYSISNLPANSSVTWSVSPSGLANLSCTNCNQTTLTRISDGTVTLTATITNGCGSTVVISKYVAVGGNIPALTGTYSTATNTLTMQTVNFVPSGNIYAQYQWPGITNISAALAPGSPSGTGFYSFSNGFSFNISSGQNISVNITGTNSCGRQTTATRTFIQSGGYSIVASPNPATSDINVSIKQVADTSASSKNSNALTYSNTSNITKMYLYDFNTGLLVKQWSFQETKSNNYNLNIADIKAGAYVLKMERNNKSTSTKIIVK